MKIKELIKELQKIAQDKQYANFDVYTALEDETLIIYDVENDPAGIHAKFISLLT